jgi:hypothetical protein
MAHITLTFAQLLTPNNNVSSANSKCDTITATWFPILYRVNLFPSIVALIITLKPSAASKNKKGDNGSLCIRPLSKGNSSMTNYYNTILYQAFYQRKTILR